MMTAINRLRERSVSAAASLAFFRILFGLLMLLSSVRFMLNGWVERYYIQPKVFFPYYGFSWIHPLPGQWMYLPFILIAVCALCILLGWYFRIAVFFFLLLFTYTEVIDLTNYLNHHYLIFLLSVLMLCSPMSAAYSLDAKRKGGWVAVPKWYVTAFQLQVGLVYCFAGIAKLKYSWLIEAQPMKIWLGACAGIPLAGKYLGMTFTAYLFSWAGMLFDISVPFLLSNKKTRLLSYVLLIIFHTLTKFLFYIGLFPFIMTSLALIFFPGRWHQSLLDKLFGVKNNNPVIIAARTVYGRQAVMPFLVLFFLLQFLLPFRYLLYPGNVLWTEQGFRYSWNVMLMEKSGMAEFYVKDKNTGKERLILPALYLSRQQLRMMSTQPDMILSFAHYLAGVHKKQTGNDAEVRVECYAALNGKGSRLLIDPSADLAKEKDGFARKKWITSL